jgi:hypothetical protein
VMPGTRVRTHHSRCIKADAPAAKTPMCVLFSNLRAAADTKVWTCAWSEDAARSHEQPPSVPLFVSKRFPIFTAPRSTEAMMDRF